MSNTKKIPVALTIAGSDSGGGAGVQADLRTFTANYVYGTSVVTSLTAQNPFDVREIFPVSKEFVMSQLEAVFSAFNISSVKTGMLFNAEIINTVTNFLNEYDINLVVDPVAVSTSGKELLRADSVKAMADSLFSMATWVTPNIPEAELFLGIKIKDVVGLTEAAVDFSRKWNCGCILKGGHLAGDEATDIISCKHGVYRLISPRIKLVKEIVAHGTGCTFSSAFAAQLAKFSHGENSRVGTQGFDEIKSSLIEAKSFVYGSLVEPVTVGEGLDAMYPPMEHHKEMIRIEKL